MLFELLVLLNHSSLISLLESITLHLSVFECQLLHKAEPDIKFIMHRKFYLPPSSTQAAVLQTRRHCFCCAAVSKSSCLLSASLNCSVAEPYFKMTLVEHKQLPRRILQSTQCADMHRPDLTIPEQMCSARQKRAGLKQQNFRAERN